MDRSLRYLTCFLLFCACASLRLAAKEPNWLKLRSEHFEVYSAGQEKQARAVLEHLERVRKAYELLTGAKIPLEKRVRVMLFRGETDYREYAPDRYSIAYYMGERDRDFIVLAGFDPRAETTLNHEYFHLFSRHAHFKFPVWLEEGLADVYSTLKITNKEVSYGYPIAGHLRYLNLRRDQPSPITRIFAIDRENRHDDDRDKLDRLYTQGWALAHMTFLGRTMRPQSELFFKKIKDGSTDSVTAYRTIYGYDTERLDRLFSTYIRNRWFDYGTLPAEGLNFRAPTESASLEQWEVPLILADLLAILKKYDPAKSRYEALAAQFPSLPEVDESRGYLALGAGDRQAAEPYFREAARKKSRNAAVYLQLAEIACDYTSADPECKAWIDEALRLNPSNKQARDWAVGYLLNTHDFQGAIAYLLGAGRVSAPDAPDFFHKLGYAHYQLRQFREAHVAVNRGLEFAKKPEEIAKLNEMERHITEAERGESAPAPSPEVHVRQGVPKQPTPSDADRAVESFLDQDGATMTAATLEAMDCSGAQPIAVMRAKGAPLRLAIDRPAAVVVIRDGAVIVDREFVCGKQTPAAVLAGYLSEGAPAGSDGLLRILSFQ